MVCRKCIVITTISDKDVARLEGELARSTARKRIITGLIMLTFGITILALGLSRGGLVLIPTGMLLGGFVELGRGLTGLSSG